jgi:predicted transcriptional regulator
MTYVILIYFFLQLNSGESPLIIPCEIAAKSVVPAIKAMMAKELVEIHGLKQSQVAEILGISQSAVSKYTRQVRGHAIEIDSIEEIQPIINRMIELLTKENYQRGEFLRLFCRTCIIIRKKGLMCRFCEKIDQMIKIEKCNFCLMLR